MLVCVLDAEEIKACPRCGAYIMKTNDGSCNRMNCTVCACQFCWLCMQEITDVHYLRCVRQSHTKYSTVTDTGHAVKSESVEQIHT